MASTTTRAQSALAQFLNSHVETLSPVAEGIASGIIWGIATARVAGVAVMALRQMSDAEIVSLVADVVAVCECQNDVPRYINARFCPPVEPLVIPVSAPASPVWDAIDEWFAAAIA